jgi:NAD(P) transhydrogenase subunit alpha
MMITAAGSIAPAQVCVMGVGVAGLSAISTAKRLGAIVSAYDVRSQTKEQVLSLGAKFLDINYKVQDENLVYAKEMDSEYKKFEEEAIINHIKSQDVIISSAMIMGKKAPILINEKVFDNIKSGAVIIDMASETGGNCIYTKDGVLEEKNGVFIWGGSKLANDFPKDSSFMYSKNILNFITYLTKESKINLEDMNDEILNSVIVCKDGNFVSKMLKGVLI